MMNADDADDADATERHKKSQGRDEMSIACFNVLKGNLFCTPYMFCWVKHIDSVAL